MTFEHIFNYNFLKKVKEENKLGLFSEELEEKIPK